MPESAIGAGGVAVVPGSTQTVYPQWMGWYYATVSSSADPLKLGRCQLRIPQVLGTEVSPWAWALTTLASTTSTAAASTTPPAVGTVVAVTFLGGDLSNPAYMLITTSATTVTTPVTTGTGSTTGSTTGTTSGGGSTTTSPTPVAGTTSLANGAAGAAYSQTIAVSGGTGPYTYAVTGGTLPSWATLNAATGAITGTPTANGTSTFTVTITDASGATTTETLTLTVGGSSIAVATLSLPTGQVSQAYSATLAAFGGTGSLTWKVSSGTLPAGLSLAPSTGVISGTPTAASTGSVTFQVTDASNNTATAGFIMTTITGPVGGLTGYTLAFADEFNVAYSTPYGTGPNPNVWADHLINGDMFRTNDDGEIQWYPHGYHGHSVANSILTLTAQIQSPRSIDPTCPTGDMIPGDTSSNPGTATSAMIASYLAYNMTYGYVEIYMQHPSCSSPGPWPQMAMYTRDNDWPPEIDIDEFNPGGHNNQTHNGYYDANSDPYQSYYFSPSSGYHAWGMALSPTHVTFYYDGTQTYQTTYDGNAFAWFLTYTLGVQTGASGGFPYSVGIDYIRAWTVTGVPPVPVITSISPSTGLASGGSIVVNFNTVSGATSYRVTASPTDAMADGYGGTSVTDTSRFNASGTTSPLTITGLPSGVRWNITCCAINATGYSAESAPVGPQMINIQMVTTILPAATIGTPYTATLAATAGVTPYTWSISSGTLPPGLALNASTGVISGTPTGPGSAFTVKVSGSTSWSGGTTVANSATASLSIPMGGSAGGGSTGNGGTLPPPSGSTVPGPSGPTGTWTNVFDDTFTNQTKLNTANWTALQGASINLVSTQASAVSVSGGYLRIGYAGAVNSSPASGYAGPSTGPSVVLETASRRRSTSRTAATGRPGGRTEAPGRPTAKRTSSRSWAAPRPRSTTTTITGPATARLPAARGSAASTPIPWSVGHPPCPFTGTAR